MCDLVRRLEARRFGFMNPIQFQNTVSYALNTDLLETKHIYPSYSSIEDATISHNRLLVIDTSGDVCGYDIAPKVNFEDEIIDTNAVSGYTSDHSIKRPALSHCSIEWSKCASFFTVTGKRNFLGIIDGTYFSEISRISIPNSSFTCMHQACPDQDNIIAVSSSSTGLVLADIKTGNVSLSTESQETRTFTTLAWSHKDPTVILTASAEEVTLWDIRSLIPRVLKVQISPKITPEVRFVDKNTVAILISPNRLIIYDLLKHKIIREITRAKPSVVHRRCKFYIEHKSKTPLLYFPSESFVNIHNLETGKRINQLGPHLEDINIVVKNERTHELYLFDRNNGHLWKPVEYSSDSDYFSEDFLNYLNSLH